MKTIIRFAEVVCTSAFFGKYTTSHYLVEELNPALYKEIQQLEEYTIVIPSCTNDKRELKKDFHNFGKDAKKVEKLASTKISEHV